MGFSRISVVTNAVIKEARSYNLFGDKNPVCDEEDGILGF
jgi:hypothetical protein